MLYKQESFGISLNNISFRIGRKTILQNVTMDIPAERTTGILGPNGAGKTTLFNLLTGLKNPTAGAIQLSNKNLVIGTSEYRRQIGVVMQETALYDELTTYENLAFSASLYGIKNPKDRIYEILELLSIADRSAHKVGTLSGGLQRRVTIGRALLHNPKLLIIDEPTLGVDADARHMIWSHLRYLRSKGTTIIVSTNYLDEALALCDTVFVIREGKLVSSKEEPEKLLAKVGVCIDIVCEEINLKEGIDKIKAIIGVIRVEKTSEGVSVFFKGDIPQDDIVHVIMGVLPIKGFKLRSPDLSEVFLLLENEDL